MTSSNVWDYFCHINLKCISVWNHFEHYVKFISGPFLTYILGGQPPPAPMLPPPVKGFAPPSKSPFSLKMSKNHTEIAGNQFWGTQKFPQNFSGEGRPDPPKIFNFPLFPAHVLVKMFNKSVFVVGPSTEKSLKKALIYIINQGNNTQ